MGMGPITWACLLLTAHQAPAPQETFLNQRGVLIRINTPAQRRANLKELVLLVSHDRGKVWTIGPVVPPSAKAFEYHAPEDGSYWFIVQEVDNDNQKNPPDPLRARPGQCLVIDSVKPDIQVTAERLSSGEIQARWTVNEKYPKESTLRVEYHTDAMRPDQWTPLPLQSSLQGDKRFFPPDNAREVVVRVRMEDKADNVGVGEGKVSLTGAAMGGSGGEGAIGVIPTMRTEQTSTPGQLASRQAVRPLDPAPQGLPTAGPPASMPPPEELNPIGRGSAGGTSGASAPGGFDRSALATGAASETPNGALPSLKIVKNRDVKLDFEVAKVGPSGLGGADVYVTLNEGANWIKLRDEVPLNLPAEEMHGSGPVRGSVNVQLPKEGVIYGFILAIKSKAGLARPAPKNGEPPQVRVELDATVPQAQLFGPMPDPNQPNALILAWNAVDRNLPADAITLEWAERKEGPWSLIADKLPNTSATGTLPPQVTGSYVWQLPERVPSRVFLRLTVRDSADNKAEAKADKPVLIDLNVPETKSVIVSPSAR